MESRRGECFQREGVVNSHELVLSSPEEVCSGFGNRKFIGDFDKGIQL